MLHDEHIYDCQRHPLIPCDSTWMSETQRRYAESWKALARKLIGQMLAEEQKEAHAMSTLKVEYNGFTGELVKLEATYLSEHPNNSTYDLTIFERDKKAEHSFKGVKLSDIKFLGGEVSFT